MKLIWYPIYLLQLENYNLSRFWRAILITKKSGAPRQTVIWTMKLRLIVAIAIILIGVVSIGLGGLTHWAVGLIFAAGFLGWFAIPLTLSVLVVWPIDYWIKRSIVFRAQALIRNRTDLKIIAITGSYGKTTMKEAIAAVVSEKYTVFKTPDNINTPVGIARLILEQVTPNVQVLVVEMGAYQRGDIAQLCALTPPDIAVLTGINESHLERFGSIKNTVVAKFEIVAQAKPRTLVILNADDERVAENAKHFVGSRTVRWYSARNAPGAHTRVDNYEMIPDGSGVSFTLAIDREHRMSVRTPLLGRYAPGTFGAAALIGFALQIPAEKIAVALSLVKPVSHRLEVQRVAGDVVVIDDSYNGNPDGVREAIAVLGRFTQRRKLYLTPGLVEAGPQAEAVHRAIGQQLAGVADVVLLIQNSVTPWIAKGFIDGGGKGEQIRVFATATEAHTALPSVLKAGDVIVFQNDWPDNYA